MGNNKLNHKVCIFAVLSLTLLAWITDAVFGWVLRKDAYILESIFRPDADALLHRIFYCVSIIIFTTVALQLANKLRSARNVAFESQAMMKNAFENTALGMSVTGLDRHYITINKAFCNITGYSKEEMLQMTYKNFCHPEDQNADDFFIRQLIDGKIDFFRSTKRYVHKLGHIIWVEATVSLIKDEDGLPKYFVAQIQDITSLKQTEDELKKAKEKAEIMARTDYLTGCLNRGAFVEHLEKVVERAKREGTPTSLILVDVDYFKNVNDTFGHLAGDDILRQFSNCIMDNSRSYDVVGRYGGEEFVICLPNTSLPEALLVAERMRSSVEAIDFKYKGSGIVRMTGSFGVATWDHIAGDNIDSFISRADNAMYEAKKNRNCISLSA